jgi:hypothetical protein
MTDGQHEGEFEGRTYLYIRTNPADTGAEPLPAGLAGWLSPDIVIVKPDNTVGGEAIAGEINQVKVTVKNGGGIPAYQAYLEVFVADPSTVILPTTATVVGNDYIDVPAYSTATASFPWTPSSADAGHRCLVARVSLIAPLDTYTNPMIFDVLGDRHVAQRNIQVVEAAQGGLVTVPFQFLAALKQASLDLRVIERTAATSLRDIALLTGGSGGLPALRPLASLEVRRPTVEEQRSFGDNKEAPSFLSRPGRPQMTANRREAEDRREPPMQELGILVLRVPDDSEVGRLHVVDVVQVDRATESVLGGLSVVLRVVDSEGRHS